MLDYRLALGDPFARRALPAVPLAFAIPAAAVAFRFRALTTAKPPLGRAVIGVIVPVVGAIASLL